MDYQTEHNNYQNAGPQDGGAKKRGAGDKQEEDDGQAFWNRTVQDADYTKTNSTTTRRQGREPSSCRHASARKPSRRSLREISVRMVIFSMPLSINGQQRAQWGSIGRSVSI
jgi:hypothetical protein